MKGRLEMHLNEFEEKLLQQARRKIEQAKLAYIKRYLRKFPLTIGRKGIDEQKEASLAASNQVVGTLVEADNALTAVLLKQLEGLFTQPTSED